MIIDYIFKYLLDQKCDQVWGPINWNLVVDPNFPPPEPKWQKDVTDVAFRTNVLAQIYLMLTIIWIITSCNLIGKHILEYSNIRMYNISFCYLNMYLHLLSTITKIMYNVWYVINDFHLRAQCLHCEKKKEEVFMHVKSKFHCPTILKLYMIWLISVCAHTQKRNTQHKQKRT